MERFLNRRGKKRSWVNPAFDDFTAEEHRPKTVIKETKTFSLSQSHNSGSEEPNLNTLWVDKHRPECKEVLAVHKKKVAEVEGWLNDFNVQRGCKKKTSVLLLTGPSGVGKTVTVQVLAKEMGFEVKEWINPLTRNVYHSGAWQDKDNFIEESQIKIFWDFMLRCNKYDSLPGLGERTSHRRLILVEDFPNIFLRNPSDFHQILRKFSCVSESPVVFIIGDNNKGMDVKSLFPNDLQQELGIRTISFNPVAATILVQALTRVASEELNLMPSKTTLESLAQLSAGDIRMAINTLQFTYATKGVMKQKTTKITKGKNKLKEKKLKSEPDAKLPSCSERDTTLYIFHAIGKVLHCKRDKTQSTDEGRLPSVAKAMARLPLFSVPEDIVANACLSGEYLSLFLHQNYLAFFSNIEDVVRGSRYLSDSDVITADWAGRATLEECSSLVVVRGLMHSNSSTDKIGWRPILKPCLLATNRLVRQRKGMLQRVCKDEAALFKELCTYPRSDLGRIHEDKLDHHDVVINEEDTLDDISTPNVPSPTSSFVCAEDEEYVIEDYDD